MAEHSHAFNVAGRTWTIHFSLATSHGLQKVGVDAVNAADLENLFALYNDRRKMVKAIWVCVERKASELGVDKDQFFDDFDGATFQVAFDAMVEAFIRFQPADVRGAMRQAVAEFYRTIKAASDAYIAATDAIDYDAIVKEQVELALAGIRKIAAPAEPVVA
jgi:hypothetical protein